jgi:uncharacterized protein (TIGR00725 family)
MAISDLSNNRTRQITVIGDANAGKEAFVFAEQIGVTIAGLGYALITGGRGGIMEAANKGAFNAGGISIGILPSASMKDANPYCNFVIPTALGHARNTSTALSLRCYCIYRWRSRDIIRDLFWVDISKTHFRL